MRKPKVAADNKQSKKVKEPEKVSCQFCAYASPVENYLVNCEFSEFKKCVAPAVCYKYEEDKEKLKAGPVKPIESSEDKFSLFTKDQEYFKKLTAWWKEGD